MPKIISVQNLSKRYKIGARQSHGGTLRESIVGRVRSPLGAARRNGDESSEFLWALKDVSFDVEQGELVGIIGPNGAGKSTLLKILSQITEPTSGRVQLYGRIGSLLEIGTGFHPELSGRENVYLNGSILGMKRDEIDRKFDEIVAFAEIERFLDTPVKRYSSGMYMRLAFSVAAHLESEILLVDEVLAVGDTEFQKRCLKKMNEVVGQGRTVLLVSHNMISVSRLCSRSIWINQGRIESIGSSDDVISGYLLRKNPLLGEYLNEEPVNPAEAKVVIRGVRVKNSEGGISSTINAQRPFFVEIEYEILEEIPFIWVGFSFQTLSGVDVLAAADGDIDDNVSTLRRPGRYRSVCQLPGNLFNAGCYLVSAYAAKTITGANAEIFSFVEHVLTFDVEHPGGFGSYMPNTRVGIISPVLNWEVSSAKLQEPITSLTPAHEVGEEVHIPH